LTTFGTILANCVDDILRNLAIVAKKRKISRQRPDLMIALTFICRLIFAQIRANLVSSGARQNYLTLRCLVLITAKIVIASKSVPKRANLVFNGAFSRDLF